MSHVRVVHALDNLAVQVMCRLFMEIEKECQDDAGIPELEHHNFPSSVASHSAQGLNSKFCTMSGQTEHARIGVRVNDNVT